MKYYLSDLLPRIKKFSASLDQTAILVDKPWVVCDNEDGFQKLIFRRDGSLLLSENGSVSDGKWEYLPEAQSMLIDYGKGIKKLYRHQFMDEAVLALKIDGPRINASSDYFLLANENIIPDLNAKAFLKEKYLSGTETPQFLIESFKVKTYRRGELTEEKTTQLMARYEIIQDGDFFLYKKYRYKEVVDAINYAIKDNGL